MADAALVDILHVELDALARPRNHERFGQRRLPAELPLGFPDEAFASIEAKEDGRRDGETEYAGDLKLHL